MPDENVRGLVPLRQVLRDEITYPLMMARARRIAEENGRPTDGEKITYATAIARARRIAEEFARSEDRDANEGA